MRATELLRATTRRVCMLVAAALLLPTWAQAAEVYAGKAISYGTSPPLRDLAPAAVKPGAKKQVPIMKRDEYGRYPDLAEPDGGLQRITDPDGQLAPTPPAIVSVPGLAESDNIATVGSSIVPPDVNGDIGFDNAGNRIYVQYINLVWGVFAAEHFDGHNPGDLIQGPFAGNTFWSGFGGPCEANNDGDPVVLYDDHAGRWFFSQFSIGEGIQCVAVSTTSDPLGAYHLYAFPVTPGGNNDYPKLGVWDDGTSDSAGQSAYTFTLRDFGGAGGPFSVSAGVLERDAILNGLPAQFVKFSNPCNADCIEGQLPPHMDGPQAPPGTCPTFWTAVDAAYDDSPHANDGYRNHTLCVDWDTPASSTYTEGPLVVAGSNFDRFLGGGFSACISPTNGGEVLDCLAAFTMYRAQYRWFGDHASVVLNTTVDAGGDRAGIRWAQASSADGDSGWFLEQDGTYAPADGLERWMGSIAQDQGGNLALGFSVTGDGVFPSVRYTTRSAGDPPGTMSGGEISCHEGTGAQVSSSNRWGDYSSMSVDPSDDCTFWYTQEYYETTSSFNFKTRICSFKLANCDPVPCTIDADCDDGLFCNGDEFCNGDGFCAAGSYACADNPTWTCDEVADDCVPECEVDADCDDGVFCNGAEICNAGTCEAGSDPCPGQGCRETEQACVDVAVYDPDLGAPVCATPASFCDSDTSVDGRAGLGPEPNQPNTLDGCADGTAGTYHNDESNDRIYVSTVGGEDFQEGSTVQIDATVWAWSTGSSDTLDLYYAADANSPSWNYITSIVPPAGGARTLSAQYVLPAGQLQAVRASFRYQGTPAECSGGAYDDADDLVFAVGGGAPECTIDADCDDGLFCNGAETCNAGVCAAGTPPACDNGLFCDGVESCNEGTDSCDAGTPPACDDGLFCNGTESCNEGTDSCNAGTPPACDDGLFCNGTESCNEGTDSCDSGTPPEDDGVSCTVDTCDEETDSVTNTPDDLLCDNGLFCDGAETCDAVLDCRAGSDPCPGESCDEAGDVCVPPVCNENGICEAGEDCNNCASDCISGTLPGAVCGNGICEAGDGESGVSCPADCNAKLGGKPSLRFSCGFNENDGLNPNGCGDLRCTTGGFSCTEVPVGTGSYCCGDYTCGGDENNNNCSLDCTVSICGNNVIEAGEACDGLDLGGQTCADHVEGPYGTLMCLPDCSDFDTSDCSAVPACVPTASKEKGPRCSDNLDNDCDGLIDGADPDC